MKKLLIVLLACILLAGCSPKKDENKKTTSYTPEEVQTIFERAGFSFDKIEDEKYNTTIVAIHSADVNLMDMVKTKDGKTTSNSVAFFGNDISYFWNDDVGSINKCSYSFKDKKAVNDTSCGDLEIKDLEKTKQSYLDLLKELDLNSKEIDSLFTKLLAEL